MIFIVRNPLFIRWIFQRRRWGRAARILHPGAGWSWLGLSLEEGVHQHQMRVHCRAYSSKYFLWTPLSFVSSCSPFVPSLPLAHGPFRLLDLFFLFCFRGCTIYIRPVTCGRRQIPVIRGRASGSQGPSKVIVAGSKAQNLYNILQAARTWPDLSTSVGPPLPQSQRHAPTAMVSHQTAKELEAIVWNLTVQEFKGHVRTGAPLLVPYPIEADIPTAMAPMNVNVSDTQQVYCCQVRGALRDPHLLVPPSVLMCAMPIWVQNWHVLSVLWFLLILMP